MPHYMIYAVSFNVGLWAKITLTLSYLCKDSHNLQQLTLFIDIVKSTHLVLNNVLK